MQSSVVIVAHQPNPWLSQSIASVLPQADQVVVVDNGSPGGVVARIGTEAGATTVVHLPDNTGFAGGYNAGTAVATGEIVAWLNDDAMAEPAWIATAAEVLADPTIAVACPKLLFARPHAEILLTDEVFKAPGDDRPLGRQLHAVSAGDRDVLARLVGPGIHQLEQVNDA